MYFVSYCGVKSRGVSYKAGYIRCNVEQTFCEYEKAYHGPLYKTLAHLQLCSLSPPALKMYLSLFGTAVL